VDDSPFFYSLVKVPMRFVILTLLLFSYVVESSECYMYDREAELIVAEKDSKAIVFGFVNSAALSENGNTVTNKFKVVATLKGEQNLRLDFQSVILKGDSTSEVGSSYVLFVPKSGKVNFCTMAYKVGNGFYTRQSLIDWADRVDIPRASKVKELLIRHGRNARTPTTHKLRNLLI
jgi:hypothetical protein